MVLCIQWLLNLAGVGLVVGGLNNTIFPTNDMCQREPLDVCSTDIATQQTCLCSGKLYMHINYVVHWTCVVQSHFPIYMLLSKHLVLVKKTI